MEFLEPGNFNGLTWRYDEKVDAWIVYVSYLDKWITEEEYHKLNTNKVR